MHRILAAVCISLISLSTQAGTVLIEDVRIFNGVDAKLTSGNVLVVDGLIADISSDSITAPEGATVIAGNNRILTPGFIDLHVHLGMRAAPTRTWHGHSIPARCTARECFLPARSFRRQRDMVTGACRTKPIRCIQVAAHT